MKEYLKKNCIFIMVIETVLLICETFAKVNLLKIIKIQGKRLAIQKKFLFDKLNRQENNRKIQHDINKHMEIIKALYDKNLFEEMNEYAKTYIQEYSGAENISTGNFIADYFIGKTIDKLMKQEDFKYKIIGRFPEKIKINDNDLCSIMGNALDNSKNAIMSLEKGGRLYIEIKNVKGYLYLLIKNNKNSNVGSWNRKKGFGIKIMKNIVDKNGGQMKIKEKNNQYEIQIFI